MENTWWKRILGIILGLSVFGVSNYFGPIGMIVGIFLGLATYRLITGEKTKSFTLTK